MGTRPEVPRYVEGYTPEMMATLLLPAGVTSTASIQFKDEADLLNGADDVDKVYVEEILPLKMGIQFAGCKEIQPAAGSAHYARNGRRRNESRRIIVRENGLDDYDG